MTGGRKPQEKGIGIACQQCHGHARPRLVSALIRSSLAGVSRLVFARQYRTTDRQAVSKPRSGEPADRPGVLAERKRKRRLSRERQNGHTAAAANAGAADKPDFSAALLVGLL